MFILKYIIKTTILIKATMELVDFTEEHTSYINMPDEFVYGNVHFLKSGNIYDFFNGKIHKYLEDNYLDIDGVDIETYEVASLTPNVQVYFENPVNNNLFTMTPNIMAFVEKPDMSLNPPSGFFGELIDANSIRWSWPAEEGYGYYILDMKDKIIAQTPTGLNSYIETLLENDKNYTRKLVKYDSEATSPPSEPITVRTAELPDVNVGLKKHNVGIKDDYTKELFVPVESSLKAFQSGIGDSLDLMVSKYREDEFFDTFHLHSNLSGIRKYTSPVYGPVPFKYKVLAKAEVPVWSKDGFIEFVVSAYKQHQITVTISASIYKPMPVKWRGVAKVEYDWIDPSYILLVDEYYNNLY